MWRYLYIKSISEKKSGGHRTSKSVNPSKAITMAICPIIIHFSTWRARSMHDVACEFARAAVRSKGAQKQLARTSLSIKQEERKTFGI